MTKGIYCLRNVINDKRYVGCSSNIEKRYIHHLSELRKLNRNIKSTNEYLFNDFKHFGEHNFVFEILEECHDECLLNKEYFWINYYNTTNLNFGYNLRVDTTQGMIVHESTRTKISERVKYEYESGVRSKIKVSEDASNRWKDEHKRKSMSKSVSNSKSCYFLQYSKSGILVNVWKNINQLLYVNPDFKWQNIYASCNKNKKSYLGYVWVKLKNIDESLSDLVRNDYYENLNYSKNKTKYGNMNED